MSADLKDRGPLELTRWDGQGVWTASRLRESTWAFVALGLALRVARYLLNYPLWWDEAFVAVNFLRRGYLDLLRPLDYGQVCPLLFLWVELAIVKVAGFSEWSLRLFPLLCSIISVILFKYCAGLILKGVPLLLAVAIFSVSFHPIRHAADVKPYAGDLLIALGLITLSLVWWKNPGRSFWLWTLAGVVPLALAFSHPAVFVAGGIGLGLSPTVWKVGRPGIWTAYGAFLVVTIATFLGLYAVFTGSQVSATLSVMQEQWGQGFPPIGNLTDLGRWFITVHTGGMFAYPCGGERGASGFTLALFLIGVVTLCRRGRATIAPICLGPFLVAILAAGLKRYPYGGVAHGSSARIMQYLAPPICLLAGLGLAALLVRVASFRWRTRLLQLCLIVLALIGIVPVAMDANHPHRTAHADHARRFARDFWPTFCQGAEPVCLRWDLGLGEWNSTNLNVAVYLCNQKIYSPSRRLGQPPRWNKINETRPLRCVLSLSEPDDARVAALLPGYHQRTRRLIDINMADAWERPRVERYVVYEFVPALD